MAIPGRLTETSRRRLKWLYVMFALVLAFNMYVVYSYFIEPFVRDPFLRTWRFLRFWINTEPLTVLFSAVFVFLNVCLYVCAGFILVSPLVRFISEIVKRFVPWRIKRRSWCFCNCSCRRMKQILHSIHDTHCNWEPQNPNTLDEKTKRCINIVLDSSKDTLSSPDMIYRLVGSSADGLGKPYTLDLKNGYWDPARKFFIRFFCFCCPCSTSYTSLRTDFDIVLESVGTGAGIGSAFNLDTEYDGSPGFTRLVHKVDVSQNPWQDLCKIFEDKTYLSSTKVRAAIYDIVNSTSESVLPASYIFGVFKHLPIIELEEKGPAVKLATYPLGQAWYWNEDQKFVTFEGDFVFGIHCYQPWPKCATGWTSRPKPLLSPEEVKQITESGFVVVAKASHKTSQLNDDVEWHISFPHCESNIINRMPKVAKACFLALKLILKNHLVYHCEDLKTYYLKTILLWELEKHPQSYWDLDNIEKCFNCLLDSLINCVNYKQCPNYWIESLNLFENVDKKDLSALVNVLQNIRKNPAPYIEDVGSLWC